MADKQRQHTGPQVYLKNFATPQKKKHYIYIFQKADKKIVFTEIGNAAVERDFYKLDAAERPLGWEDFYSEQIEPQTGSIIRELIKKASPVLLRPRATILDNKEKALLSVYMMYQVARGRAARNFMIPITQKTAHEVTETLRAKYSLNVDDQLRAYIKSGLSKVAMAEASINPTRMENLARHLLSRYWVLYRIDGDAEFITSDNPVMFVDNSTRDATPFSHGLGAPSTVVYYPISPKLMIVTYSKDYAAGALEDCDSQIIMLDANKERAFIDFVNEMQISQCVIQAFAHSISPIENVLGDGLNKRDKTVANGHS